MSQTVFLRLLQAEDKAAKLVDAVACLREGQPPNSVVHVVDPNSFRQVPGSPFAYFTPSIVFQVFRRLPTFENDRRNVRCGMGTLDDFRFLRTWWEVEAWMVGHKRTDTYGFARWIPFAKGGCASPYYSPVPLVVDYRDDGAELKAFVREKVGSETRKVQAQGFYFRPGITFGRRIRRFSPAALPAGCIFSDSANSVFCDGDDAKELFDHLVILNGSTIRILLSMFVPLRKMEVGYLQRLPFVASSETALAVLGRSCFDVVVRRASCDELGHVFHLPALLQVFGKTLSDRIACVRLQVVDADRQLAENQRAIDDIAFRLYGIEGEDRRAIEEGVATPTPSDEGTEESEDDS